jgi:hypothetical protein
MVVRMTEQATERKVTKREGLRLVWQGTRIAKIIFATGKVVEFH